MNKYLKDIADIYSGYTFRTRLENNDNGDTHVIQFRDVDAFNRINTQTPVKIDGRKFSDKHFLTDHDVLFLAKSQYNYAIPYQNAFTKAIASSTFLILRVKSPEVDPKYLAWYINQKPAQQFFHKRTAGTYLQNLAKKDVEALPVTIPELDKQHKIVNINELLIRENELVTTIISKKNQLVSQELLETIKEV